MACAECPFAATVLASPADALDAASDTATFAVFCADDADVGSCSTLARRAFRRGELGKDLVADGSAGICPRSAFACVIEKGW